MWRVEATETFDLWFNNLDDTDRTNVLALMIVLQQKGPELSRPYADTVKGSRYKNMKELRIQSKGEPIRAFFAFDPDRKAILLCGASKAGGNKRFYEAMLLIADNEYTAHLQKINGREIGNNG